MCTCVCVGQKIVLCCVCSVWMVHVCGLNSVCVLCVYRTVCVD